MSTLKTMALLAALLTAGCAHFDAIEKSISHQKERTGKVFEAASIVTDAPRVRVYDKPFVPVKLITEASRGDWLRDMKGFSLQASQESVPISQLVAMLSARGVNIVSDLPLNNYTYAGVLNETDAYSALKIVLGTSGLDFQTDDLKRLVMIKPMGSRTWFFNIGRRSTSFSAGPGGTAGGGIQQPQQQNLGMMPNQMVGQPYGTTGMVGGQQQALNAAGGIGVQTQDSFWQSLEAEIKARLSILVPNKAQTNSNAAGNADPSPPPQLQLPPGMPGQPGQQVLLQLPPAGAVPTQTPSVPATGVQGYSQRLVGSYTLNPDTGAVTIQAPHWILDSFEDYFKRLQDSNNAEISYTGQLVLVSDRDTASQGFDIQGFTSWLSKKYSAYISNNSLGGVTVSFPTSGSQIPQIAAGNMPITGPLLGIEKIDGLRLFNAYLAERGGYSVLQQPVISTTSGVPAEFKKTTTRHYNTVSQNVASSTTTAAVGTQNQINSVDLGTILRVNPRLDISTGLVRTQLTLTQNMSSGNQQIPQSITSTSGGVQTYVATIPILTHLSYSGEVLLRDGDLIIVGGQKEETLSVGENGLPGPHGVTTVGGIAGSRTSQREVNTYYFALQVSINKRK